MITSRVVYTLIGVPLSSALAMYFPAFIPSAPEFREILPSIFIIIIPFVTMLFTYHTFREKYKFYEEVFVPDDDELRVESVKFDELRVNELESINTIIYIELFAIIGISIIYNLLPAAWKSFSSELIPGARLYLPLGVYPFIATVYGTFWAINPLYFRKDFGFHFARKYMMVLNLKSDEVEKIQYLMLALKWYRKFIKRNLKLEFDSTKIYSRILSNENKKQDLDELVTSFQVRNKQKQANDKYDIDDKLKPISCISKIANLPPSESFLTQKKLSTTIKEIAAILTAIIPVLITVLQFILP